MTIHKEARIAARAYEIWEQAGRPHGLDRQHWLQASAEIEQTVTVVNGDAPVDATPSPVVNGDAPIRATPSTIVTATPRCMARHRRRQTAQGGYQGRSDDRAGENEGRAESRHGTGQSEAADQDERQVGPTNRFTACRRRSSRSPTGSAARARVRIRRRLPEATDAAFLFRGVVGRNVAQAVIEEGVQEALAHAFAVSRASRIMAAAKTGRTSRS